MELHSELEARSLLSLILGPQSTDKQRLRTRHGSYDATGSRAAFGERRKRLQQSQMGIFGQLPLTTWRILRPRDVRSGRDPSEEH